MMVAVFSLSSCKDDDTPTLTSSVAPNLYGLDVDVIDGTSSVVTFNWSDARFRMDGEERGTSIGSYEFQGIKYTLQGDLAANDFENPVVFGEVIGKNYLAINYETIAEIMTKNFGMVRDDEKHDASLKFRLVAQYGSTENLSLVSNVVDAAFTLTEQPPYEGEKTKLFISVATDDWSPSTLVYAWGDSPDTDLFGGWGGYKLEGNTVSGPDGNQYYEVPLNDSFYKQTVHLIIHDEVNDGPNRVEGQDVLVVTFADETEDVYLRVTGNEIDGYDVKRVEKPLPKLYVKSDLGWSDYAFYAWADGNPVEAEWPGILPVGQETINGETWLVFEPSKPYTRNGTNWIINNNGGGSQFDLMQGFNFTQNTFVRVAANGAYTVSNGPVQTDGYVVYVIDQTGWDAIACYQWGQVDSFGGEWPGKTPDGTVTFGGNTYKYFNFGADVKGLNQNLILNNNNNGVQLKDFNFIFERNLFLVATPDGVTEL